MDISPYPFVVSLSLCYFFHLIDLSSLGSWTCPYSTTNQQYGIPCFINEETPNWPVRTRECVVEGGGTPPETMTKTRAKRRETRNRGKAKKKRKAKEFP
jgi:hypothetical protein